MYSEDIIQFQVGQGVRTNCADLFGLWKYSQTSNKSISEYLKMSHGSILAAFQNQDTPNWNISN